MEDALDVDIEDALPFCLGDFEGWLHQLTQPNITWKIKQEAYLIAITRPRIVHQHIQSAKLGDCSLNHGLPVRGTRHVDFLEDDVCWVLGCDALAACFVDVGDYYFAAFLCEPGCDCGAEAGTAAWIVGLVLEGLWWCDCGGDGPVTMATLLARRGMMMMLLFLLF